MASIRQLFVTLSLKAESFNNDIRAAQKEAKEFEKTIKPTTQLLGDLGKSMIGVGAAISAVGVPFALAAKGAIDAAEEFGNMAARTGLTVEVLSSLAHAAKLADTDMGAVEAAIRRSNVAFEDAVSKGGAAAETFNKLHLPLQDLFRLSPDQRFFAISKAIAAIEDPTLKAAVAAEVWGKQGTALFPMLEDLAKGQASVTMEAERFNEVITGEQAAAAARFNDSMDRLTASFKGLFNAIVSSGLLDSLTSLINRTADMVAGFGRAHPTLLAFGAAIGGISLVVGPATVGLGLMLTGAANAIPVIINLTKVIQASSAAMTVFNAISAAAFPVAILVGGLALIKIFTDLIATIKVWNETAKEMAKAEQTQAANIDKSIENLKKHGIEISKNGKTMEQLDAEVRKATQGLFIHEKSVKTTTETTKTWTFQTKEQIKALEDLRDRAKKAQEASAVAVRAAIDDGRLLFNTTNLALYDFGRATDAVMQDIVDLAKEADRIVAIHAAAQMSATMAEMQEIAELANSQLARSAEAAVASAESVAQGVKDASVKHAEESRKAQEEEAKKTQQIWATALGNITGDFVQGLSGIIFAGKDFGDAMVNIAKQTARAMFEAFLVGLLTPLTKRLGELGASLAGTLSGIFGGGAGVPAAVGGGAGAGGAAAGGAGAGGASFLAGTLGTALLGAGVGAAGFGIAGLLAGRGINKTISASELDLDALRQMILFIQEQTGQTAEQARATIKPLSSDELRAYLLSLGAAHVTNNFTITQQPDEDTAALVNRIALYLQGNQGAAIQVAESLGIS